MLVSGSQTGCLGGAITSLPPAIPYRHIVTVALKVHVQSARIPDTEALPRGPR